MDFTLSDKLLRDPVGVAKSSQQVGLKVLKKSEGSPSRRLGGPSSGSRSLSVFPCSPGAPLCSLDAPSKAALLPFSNENSNC